MTQYWLMAKSTVTGAGLAAGAAHHTTLDGQMPPFVLEGDAQWTADASYTAQSLWFRISANTLSVAVTVRTRLNGANGNISIAPGAAQSGNFHQSVGTDALVAGSLYNLNLSAPAGTGTATFTTMSMILEDTTEDNAVVFNGGNPFLFTADRYVVIAGSLYASAVSTTEADVTRTARTATSYTNMRVIVTANTTTAATVSFRKNSVTEAGLSVSITSGTTGAFTDDGPISVANGDEINTLFDVTSGTSVTVSQINYTAEAAMPKASRFAAGAAFTATNYTGLSGALSVLTATEADAQIRCRRVGDIAFRNLYVRSSANTRDGATTAALRRNAANSISVSIPANTSGIFEETTTVDRPDVNALFNYGVTLAGSSGTCTLTMISIEQVSVIDVSVASVAATATAAANTAGTSVDANSVAATATAAGVASTPRVAVTSLASTATAAANPPGNSLSTSSAIAEATAAGVAPIPKITIGGVTATAAAAGIAGTIRLYGVAEVDVDIAKTFFVKVSIKPTYKVAITIAHTYRVEITMSSTTCYVGNSITATGTFTSRTGVIVDPTTVTAVVQAPTGVETDYLYGTDPEVVREEEGVYACTFIPDSHGTWTVQFNGTGNAIAVNEETFLVLAAI